MTCPSHEPADGGLINPRGSSGKHVASFLSYIVTKSWSGSVIGILIVT